MNLLTTNSKVENTPFTLAAGVDDVGTRAANPAFRLDLLRSLRMHPVLASSVTALSFVLLLLYGLAVKPVYEAETFVHVQPEPATLLGGNLSTTFDSGRYDSFLQEQIQRMQRADTISAALERLPRNSWTEYGSSQESATEKILEKLKIARVTTSYQVSLTLKGSDADSVTAVANAITYAYLDLVRKETLVENDERAGLLGEERQRVATELRRDQEEQSALGASLGVANPDGEGDPYEGELAALREQLVEARSLHAAAATRLASLNGQSGGHGSALAAAADEAILSDTGLSTLKSSISERRATLRGQMAGMTPDNPLRRRDQEELSDLDHSLEEMTAKLRAKSERDLQEKLRAELQRTGNLEAWINAQLAQRTAAATSATPKLQRAAELNGEVKRLLLRQAEIEDATRSLQLEANRPGAARLTLAAQRPTSPEGNRKRLFLIASLPLALMLGAAAAATARKCDQRIYTVPDVAKALGFPPLAVLPASDEASETMVAEDVLRMAGAIMSAYRAKKVHTFLFTAVSSQTDIEPLSRMLLEKFRQTGIDACCIAARDLLLPAPPDQKHDSESPSLSEISSLLPALATNQGVVDLRLTLLQARHSIILIQASHLGDSAETEYIARCANATILVVESRATTRAELVNAAELLRRLHVPAMGVVLQGLRMRDATPRTRQPFSASVTGSLAGKTRIEEQALFQDASEASVGSSLVNETAASAQTEQCQPIREADTGSIVSASSDSAVLTQTESEFKKPGLSYTQPIQYKPAESTENAQVAKEQSSPEVLLEVHKTATPLLTPDAGLEGGLLESWQQHFSCGGSPESTEAAGIVDGQVESDLDHLELSRFPKRQCGEEPEFKTLGHTLPSKLRRSSVEQHDGEQLGQLVSLLENRRCEPMQPVHHTKLECPSDYSRASSVQLRESEDLSDTAQDDHLAQQEKLLTRPWGLLSRFQQASILHAGLQSADVHEQAEPEQHLVRVSDQIH